MDFMQTCLIGNTAFKRENKPLGRAKQSSEIKSISSEIRTIFSVIRTNSSEI